MSVASPKKVLPKRSPSVAGSGQPDWSRRKAQHVACFEVPRLQGVHPGSYIFGREHAHFCAARPGPLSCPAPNRLSPSVRCPSSGVFRLHARTLERPRPDHERDRHLAAADQKAGPHALALTIEARPTHQQACDTSADQEQQHHGPCGHRLLTLFDRGSELWKCREVITRRTMTCRLQIRKLARVRSLR